MQNCELLSCIFITADELLNTVCLVPRQSQILTTWHRRKERYRSPLLYLVPWPASGGWSEGAAHLAWPLLGQAWDSPANTWHLPWCQHTGPFVFIAPLLSCNSDTTPFTHLWCEIWWVLGCSVHAAIASTLEHFIQPSNSLHP